MQSENLNNQSDPPSLESAQYSVPYTMVTAALLGEKALSPMTPDGLHLPYVVALAKKNKVRHDPALDTLFPTQNPLRVRISTISGIYAEYVTAPWGEPDTPPSREELVRKFHDLARGKLPEQQISAIVSGVENLLSGTADPLLKALAGHKISA